jgi:hypothetical protein
LNEVIESLGEEQRTVWDHLYFTTRDGIIHPLIYPHPVTSLPTLCFHCGTPFVATFLTDYDRESNQAASAMDETETRGMLADLTRRLEANHYSHTWEVGDFCLIDNLAGEANI